MKNKTKWTLTAVAFLLIAVLLAGLCLQLFGKGNVKPSEWFKKDEQTEELPEENGGAVITESNSYGVSLLSEIIAPEDYEANGISPQAENAYTLTATVTPDFAIDKTVDWSIRFTDPSSAWATGKTVTDYVIVTPTSDGALTANVTCLKAFGEEISICVTSRQNPSAKATCFVDYIKRLKSVSADLHISMIALTNGPMGDVYTTVLDKTYAINGTALGLIPFCQYSTIGSRGGYVTSYTINEEWSDGTIENKITSERVYIIFHPPMVSALSSQNITLSSYYDITAGSTADAATKEDYVDYNLTFNQPCLLHMFNLYSDDASVLKSNWTKLANALNNVGGAAYSCSFAVEVVSETGERQTQSSSFGIDISTAFNVSSVSLGGAELVF